MRILTSLLVAAALMTAAPESSAQAVLGGSQCQTLYAGQTIDAGTVCVEVVGNDLLVTFTTANGWELVETHVWVGDNLADLPQNRKGNPVPGRFPYKSGDITGATTYTATVPLANLGFSCPGPDVTYFVAAHCALRKDDGNGGYQTETGWADGDRFVQKGNWGTYFSFVMTCDSQNPDPPGDCETAFATFNGVGFNDPNSTCFLDIDEDADGNGDFNRWGWSNAVPFLDGTYTLNIFAGAGQCDVTKGTLVGFLTVEVDTLANNGDGEATITYTMSSGFTMEETHLYVGGEILARDNNWEFTVAPGQYPHIQEDLGAATTNSYVVALEGIDFNVVAHAVVCSDA